MASIFETVSPGVRRPWIAIAVGRTQYELRQYTAAETSLRSALETVPDMQPARFGLGTTLLMLDRPGDAVPILERAIEQSPGDAMARRALGHAFALENDLVKGEDLRFKLVEKNPRDDEAWLYSARKSCNHLNHVD